MEKAVLGIGKSGSGLVNQCIFSISTILYQTKGQNICIITLSQTFLDLFKTIMYRRQNVQILGSR